MKRNQEQELDYQQYLNNYQYQTLSVPTDIFIQTTSSPSFFQQSETSVPKALTQFNEYQNTNLTEHESSVHSDVEMDFEEAEPPEEHQGLNFEKHKRQRSESIDEDMEKTDEGNIQHIKRLRQSKSKERDNSIADQRTDRDTRVLRGFTIRIPKQEVHEERQNREERMQDFEEYGMINQMLSRVRSERERQRYQQAREAEIPAEHENVANYGQMNQLLREMQRQRQRHRHQ
ncbi:hypothetical protein HK096_009482 [Nowakowskiella sp. JEL0078]|nr:hypothetical protein HK096_009482 [Nowakowskiella sp. JEL0078]